ncbi:MAG: hypothetical protein CV088_19575, partial [Nitrospira sp. LK70]|nr:hypothetical protein [Nitrospira sp. LK70]
MKRKPKEPCWCGSGRTYAQCHCDRQKSSAPRFPWTHIWGILPLIDGGVHGEIEGGTRPLLLAQKDGCRASGAA